MFKLSQVRIQCIAWAFFVNVVLVHCDLEVKISSGILKGQVFWSRDGRLYYSYTGIPYAKPPIGELRFKAPEPVESWNGTLDATKESNKCVQINANIGQEDCLYLNVYSPKVNKKLLPVMFWIHGGKFSEGYNERGSNGPEYFMDKDVIIVSVHYRLGLLGFLSTEDDIIPGNNGMKDQVEALRWVQKNIGYFNGDPSQVTIFGESAGGVCTGFHLLSPMSKNLFHKAILQSGSPVCLWAIPPQGVARKRAHSIATIAGCNYDTSEDILKCLRKLPTNFIITLQNKMYAWLGQLAIPFTPVVENCSSGQEAFLCHHPIYDFKQESFVPVIVGSNSAEGGLFVASLYNDTSLVHTELRTNFNHLASILLFYNLYIKPENIDKVGERVLKEYFPSDGLVDHTHENAVNMTGDVGIHYCIVDFANKLSSPVYSYIYDYQNEFSFNKLFGSCKKHLGVTHADELTSLLKMSNLNPNDLNAKDLEVSKLMVNIWYKFVISEIPTIDGSDSGIAWPKFTSNKTFPTLLIDSAQPKIIQNPFQEKYKFWSQLLKFDSLNQNVSIKSPDIHNEL